MKSFNSSLREGCPNVNWLLPLEDTPAGRLPIKGIHESTLPGRALRFSLPVTWCGQGQPKDMDINSVVSEIKGNFQVSDGVVTFSNLSFGVVGALVNLSGTYNLDNGGLVFTGN